MLLFQPFGKLLESKHVIRVPFVIRRLVLFSNARSDENDFRVGVTTFDVLRVRLHRRKNVRKIRKFRGEIFLNKKVYRVTARSNNNVAFFVAEQSFVLVFDDRRADGSLLRVRKPEFFERGTHTVDSDALVVSDK